MTPFMLRNAARSCSLSYLLPHRELLNRQQAVEVVALGQATWDLAGWLAGRFHF